MSFLAAQYGTVSDIEIVWTLLAFVGAIFSLHNLKDALGDKRVLRTLPHPNGRLLIAKMSVRMESARSIIQAIFVFVGVLAMFVSDPPPTMHSSLKHLLVSGAARWSFVIGATLLSLQSYWGYSLRAQLVEKYSIADKQEADKKVSDKENYDQHASDEYDRGYAANNHESNGTLVIAPDETVTIQKH